MTMAIEPKTHAAVSTHCAGCGQETWTTHLVGVVDYLTNDTFDIARCDHCQLEMTSPLPVSEEIGRYYPQRYRGNRHGFTGPMRSMLRRKAVERCFAPGFRGRLLDIGCGDGSFARHMKAHGWDVCVTEIDGETLQRLGALGIQGKLPALAEVEGFDGPFDAITCWHVLEHVQHPRRVADWVHTQLKPDGVFQVTVPNLDSLQAKVFSKTWIHLDVPRHRQHFIPSSLAAMLKDTAFQITHQTNVAWEYDWFGIIQSALNLVCKQPNVLFDRLIGTPGSATPAPLGDQIISWVLTPVIAMVSVPMIIAAAVAGDGATLTFTCKAV